MFAVNSGKLTDRFVGMLPQDQLQNFLVRVVTGYGDRVQAADISDSQLKELTTKISFLAGLGSFNVKKKEKLNSMIDEALNMDGGMDQSSGALSAAIQTALLYIENASKDVRVRDKLVTGHVYCTL